MRPRAWLAALLLVLAQAATAAHAVDNDHALTGTDDELCLLCLHGNRHDGMAPPEAAPAWGPANLSAIRFSLPQDRHPDRTSFRTNGARAPPRHSSTA
ncbi:MAG: hypothetical protein ACLFWF_13440 [Alphaproteobacteria bacterium]